MKYNGYFINDWDKETGYNEKSKQAKCEILIAAAPTMHIPPGAVGFNSVSCLHQPAPGPGLVNNASKWGVAGHLLSLPAPTLPPLQWQSVPSRSRFAVADLLLSPLERTNSSLF